MTGRRPVVVTGPLPPPVHGAAVVTGRMRDVLLRRGVDVLPIDSNDNAPAGRRLARLALGLLRLAALVAARRRPAVYVGGAGGELLWFQALVVGLGRLGGGPVVFHHHNYGPLMERARALAALVRLGGPQVTHVVLGPQMAAALREVYPRVGRVVVCSNAGHMAPASTAEPRTRSDRVVLGHLSNLTMAKGVGEVVAAAQEALRAGLDVELRLAGPAVEPESAALVEAARAELGDRFAWTGALRPDEVDDFVADLDLFLFPSTYRLEAEPLVVLEASRSGVPTLAYDVGCVAGLIDPPGRVLDRAEPFAAAVADVVRGLAASTPERRAAHRDDVRRGFAARQGAAAATWEDLVDELCGSELPSR